MKLKRPLIRATALASIFFLGGCGIFKQDVTLYPILTQDIQPMKAGETFTAPRDGYFLSSMYLKEVAQVKVKK